MNRRNFIKITFPLALTGNLTARLADTKKPILRFGVIADPQYADKAAVGNRHYRQSIQKLKDSIDDLNKRSLDFVVTLGDVIDTDFKSFGEIMPLYDQLKVPHRAVLGNHDFAVANKDKRKVMKAMNLKKSYHSESIKGWRFIYLDSTEISLFRYSKNHRNHRLAKQFYSKIQKQKRPQAYSWNSGLSEEQMEWFKDELAMAKKAKQPVIIFNHNPVYPVNSHNLWNDKEVVEIISKNNHVVAYMNGHNHGGNYAQHKGCHYVNFKGMVETKHTTAYAVVECFADRLEIDGLGVEPNRNLTRKI